MTFPLINYDGNKGENNDDEVRLRTINHLREGRRDSYKNNLVTHRLSECSHMSPPAAAYLNTTRCSTGAETPQRRPR